MTSHYDALETREAFEESMRAAATVGFEAVVDLLLERGADLSAAAENGWTALMWAATCWWSIGCWNAAPIQTLQKRVARSR